jgi:putative transposase
MVTFKKPLRLQNPDYLGRRTYFVTVVTEKHREHFRDLELAKRIRDKLIALSAKLEFSLHAYCVMPDHIHFLTEGLSDTANFLKLVDIFKQTTAYEFAKMHGEQLWQKRYYDHILRRSELVEDAAAYIWWNPVRKNLCADPKAYPLTGSQTLEWITATATTPKWQPPWKSAQATT